MAFPQLVPADRAALGLWGDPVRYTTSDGKAVDLRGIFDAAYVLGDAGRAGVTTVGPRLWVRLDDLQLPGRVVDPDTDPDPTITVAGAAYTVRDMQRDGQGGATLFLQKAG